MANSVAYIGRGSHFQIYSGAAFISVAQLQKFNFSGIKLTMDDITNIDSPSSYKEFLPVIIDPGDVSLEGIFNPEDASQTDLLTACQSMTLTQFKIILSDPALTTLTFSGYVVEYAPIQIETTKAVTFTAKVQITGPVVLGS
jgi:hypothetical protein